MFYLSSFPHSAFLAFSFKLLSSLILSFYIAWNLNILAQSGTDDQLILPKVSFNDDYYVFYVLYRAAWSTNWVWWLMIVLLMTFKYTTETIFCRDIELHRSLNRWFLHECNRKNQLYETYLLKGMRRCPDTNRLLLLALHEYTIDVHWMKKLYILNFLKSLLILCLLDRYTNIFIK